MICPSCKRLTRTYTASARAVVRTFCKNLQNLETMSLSLKGGVVGLERKQASNIGKRLRADQLSHLKSELASRGCEADFNKAASMAIASGLPSTTCQGAAALYRAS